MPAGPAGCDGASDTGRVGVGVAYGFADTELGFSETRFQLSQQAVAVSGSYQVSERWILRASAGAMLDGELTGTVAGESRVFDLNAGPSFSLGAATQVLGENDANLILSLSFSAGVTLATTTALDAGGNSLGGSEQDYTAVDLRFGALLGVTLFDRWTPFLLARAFGGPVSWNFDDVGGRTGTDTTHVQLGVGSALTLVPGVSLFVEGVFFGERGVATGFEIRP
ncbi:MAG: hypothetical protein ACI9MR_002022 [Myxococcota bacterium]|jgi:hypothetical protein